MRSVRFQAILDGLSAVPSCSSLVKREDSRQQLVFPDLAGSVTDLPLDDTTLGVDERRFQPMPSTPGREARGSLCF